MPCFTGGLNGPKGKCDGFSEQRVTRSNEKKYTVSYETGSLGYLSWPHLARTVLQEKVVMGRIIVLCSILLVLCFVQAALSELSPGGRELQSVSQSPKWPKQ